MDEIVAKGWKHIDVILFSGDAYVDHPSFGIAVIGRILQDEGLNVAIVPQPNWQDDLRDFKKLGKPRLFFGVSAGNMDSMVNHYTAAKRLRSDDAYTAGAKAGRRPDRATVVYSKILKQLYPDTPVFIGGIEASLRRLTHYDYWLDKLLPSVLVDSNADFLLYGMGDKIMREIAKSFKRGYDPQKLKKISQVVYKATHSDIAALKDDKETIFLNSFQSCIKDKKAFGQNFCTIEQESNAMKSKRLVEKCGEIYVVANGTEQPLTEQEIDATYNLPFTRKPHPRYRKSGNIPAYEMIKYSVNIHRGCFGGCSFCTISAHQGKHITSRSSESIIKEIHKILEDEDFKGNLSDIGGPSANMWKMSGKNIEMCAKCRKPSCIYPRICRNLNNDHSELLKLYRKVREIKGIKKAYIGSGIRYDMFDDKTRNNYLREIIVNHTSGRLKVAPEHTEDKVLKTMRKPSFTLFEKLNEDFKRVIEKEGLRYQLIPYFISSHPSCDKSDMIELRKKMKDLNFNLEQVQDFTPTPMTLSSVMFYTGEDPYTGEKMFVEKFIEKKKEQKELFFIQKGKIEKNINNRYGKKK